ncbi:MAG: GFA family protein [Magnetospirillum sp.]|nr:GFA family protein [Magnetospirillum sp.]
MLYEGGCLCGAVRYRIEGEPLSAGYCHCRMCRRAAGAPVAVWAAFRRDQFAFVKGQPDSLPASDRAVRRFCGRCGTALMFEYSGETTSIDVSVASLDDPNAAEPLRRIWMASRLPWPHREGGGDDVAGRMIVN